ncbi:mandelate racemase [Rhizobium laguerreae]|uniref:enolase C-terminal domain-like protein n=1 Tax=Rhizobium laguerreae TaxID=1076926 RepID=UPI001C9073FF|nr:enolase C-terminal domain-like protein [Rhizobium laguerreae]MBY3163900.1 mandelate racemase [Rhizobium laguerreae]
MGVIEKIELIEFSYPVANVGPAENGFDTVYVPNVTAQMNAMAVRIQTADGCVGEYVGGLNLAFRQAAYLAPKLVGRNAFHRIEFYEESKRALRKFDKMGVGLLDIALWDWAGKRLNVSVANLIGSSRARIPVYASTYHGDRNGGLSSPEDFASFAEHCRDLGYRAFKMHGWGEGIVEEEVASVKLLGARVGQNMKLMLDPASHLRTFADALAVGKACDEAGFFWLEDPFRDTGVSQMAHKMLRERISTPLLIGEHVRGFENKSDFARSGASDFVRVNPDYDMGITGALKVGAMAESLGLDVEVHSSGPAHRHCVAAFRNTNFYELALVGPKCGSSKPPVYTCGFSDTLEAIGEDGQMPVPTGIGLGVGYDWEFIRRNAKNTATFG